MSNGSPRRRSRDRRYDDGPPHGARGRGLVSAPPHQVWTELRTVELDALREVACARPTTSQVGVLVVGPEGSGRTTLLSRFAASLDGVVVRVSARPTDGAPLRLARSVARQLADAARHGAAVHPRLLELADAADSTKTGTLSQEPALTPDQVEGEATPCWVLIDDVEHTDPDGRRVLALLATHGAALGCGVVATALAGSRVPELHGWSRVPLAPARQRHVAEAALRTRGVHVPDEVVREVLRAGEGSLAVVDEILGSLGTAPLHGTGSLRDPLPLGPVARATARRRLDRVPTVHLPLLRVVAAVGRLDLAIADLLAEGSRWPSVCQVPPGVLTVRGGRVRLTSELVRGLLRERMTPDDVAAVHHRVLTECAGMEDAESTRLRRAAASPHTPELADDVLRSAEEALAQGEGRRARELLDLGARHVAVRHRARLAVLEARVAFERGHLDDAVVLSARSLPRLPPSPERLRIGRVHVIASTLVSGDVPVDLAHRLCREHAGTEPEETLGFAYEVAQMCVLADRLDDASDFLAVTEGMSPMSRHDLAVHQLLGQQITPDDHSARAMRDTRVRGFRTDYELVVRVCDLLRSGHSAEASQALGAVSRERVSATTRLLLAIAGCEALRAGGQPYALRSVLQELDASVSLGRFATGRRVALWFETAASAGAWVPDHVEVVAQTWLRAADVGPAQARVLLARGWWHLACGRSEPALQDLLRAWRSCDVPGVPAHRGEHEVRAATSVLLVDALVARGRPDDAKRHRAAVTSSPEVLGAAAPLVAAVGAAFCDPDADEGRYVEIAQHLHDGTHSPWLRQVVAAACERRLVGDVLAVRRA
ncbi:AAA family ATPase [Oerskovia flava]|uniref:AAA family ATPase n=1 Tax=Oerskovia flava TaxID=2986422 RepID=UPI0022405913|nr:ATP-binding protein [Oerskovia sp. JB1-3-2]